jgi:hypothetical protein
MQAQAPTQDQAPNAPLAPAPQVIITRTGADVAALPLSLPKTSAEVEALQTRKQELTEELANVSARRHELSEEIRVAPDGASRTGLEARLRLMDQRILQLETDIGTTSKQLSSTPAEVLAIAQSDNRPPNNDGSFGEGLAAGLVPLLSLFAIVTLWRRFKRRRRGGIAPGRENLIAESNQRLERLEHGMEAIAIEIERVSEGQRFVTRLLSEQAPVGAANRIAQP